MRKDLGQTRMKDAGDEDDREQEQEAGDLALAKAIFDWTIWSDWTV
jgi:hypothetical protein